MAYTRKASASSSRFKSGNSNGGRGTPKRSAGRNTKSGNAKSATRRVTADKPQTIRIEIVAPAENGVSRPVAARIVAPRKAQF